MINISSPIIDEPGGNVATEAPGPEVVCRASSVGSTSESQHAEINIS